MVQPESPQILRKMGPEKMHFACRISMVRIEPQIRNI